MKRRVRLASGAARLMRTDGRRRAGEGFTLLEMCMVLLIMAILVGGMLPALHSAFVESGMRADERQLSLMVRTGMVRSSDQRRNYVLELTTKNLDLHPAGETKTGDDDLALDQKKDANSGDDEQAYQLNGSQLLIPDPEKANAWITMPAISWVFQPGELCPATRVRLMQGKSWLEVSFNALTGNVENEAAYFP